MGVSGLCKEKVVNHFTDPSLILSAFNKPLVCHIATKVLCPCVDGPDSIGKTKLMQHLRQYRQAMTDLVRTSKLLLIKVRTYFGMNQRAKMYGILSKVSMVLLVLCSSDEHKQHH